MKTSQKIVKVLSTLSLPIILILLFAVYSILLPDSFPTAYNIKTLINTKSPVVLLALAVLVPIAAGHFDLSVGYNVCLMHILAVGLQVNQGLPWGLTCLILLLLGVVVGVFNGVLVTRVGIDSFIATLGTGQILYGLAFWYSNGAQIVGMKKLPAAFLALATTINGWLPVLFVIMLIIAAILWIFLEFTPVGRYMYMLGSNVKAAELAGINPRKYLLVAFSCSGVLTALSGILLAAQLRVGQISVGPDYLMNSFAGALLGATTIKVGRVNVWGTVCAVFMMAVAVAGLQQLGAKYYVEPIFNGAILLIAVAFQMYSARKRIEINKEQLAEKLVQEDLAQGQA